MYLLIREKVKGGWISSSFKKKKRLEFLLWCNGIGSVSGALGTQVQSPAQHRGLSTATAATQISSPDSCSRKSICCGTAKKGGKKKEKKKRTVSWVRHGLLLTHTGVFNKRNVGGKWIVSPLKSVYLLGATWPPARPKFETGSFVCTFIFWRENLSTKMVRYASD